MTADLRKAALDYHRYPVPGKISVTPTKAMATQRDLALAYSPGVAEACLAIHEQAQEVDQLTARSNLVAVITNGTAVLGLGNIGPLASKPVMEGKGCLFKKFAGIDVFDIELAENDPDALVDTIARMEPTFGGINLEDIKAPECFYIEKKLKERMSIPVFHDDQHGTAIVAAAAVLNALEIVGKQPSEARLVCSGAGAAAIACLELLVSLGVQRSHITICDSKGVVHSGRSGLDESKQRFALDTEARTLGDALVGADIFMGLSSAGVLKSAMVEAMAARPVILAMANPTPEIMPEEALAVRPDAIIGTGRSDYPNQVNNVLCFPFIFRGALDCGATTINEAMKLAAVRAIAQLAKAEIPDVVARAYDAKGLRFGPEYLIPKPFDPRLIEVVAPAVAQAAMDSGVARRPIADMAAYREQLHSFVYKTRSAMAPVFSAAKRASAKSLARVAYAEGEDERVLRAAQVVVDEGLARPVLIGRRQLIEARLAEYGLRLEPGRDIEIFDLEDPAISERLADDYLLMNSGRGLSREYALSVTRLQSTLAGTILLQRGVVDALLCGTHGRYASHVDPIRSVIGMRTGVHTLASMQMLILPERQLFICDTQVNQDPNAEQIAEIALLAAAEARRFGIEPRVALLSHSNNGSSDSLSALKMFKALRLVKAADPDLKVAGEMRADAALDPELYEREAPGQGLGGEANVLVMPNLDAANISFNLLRMAAGNGITVGGILLGAAKPVHILAPSSTVRRIVNMTAFAVQDADARKTAVTTRPQNSHDKHLLAEAV
ncbi:MAG: malic enzyme [Pseudomonadota bacterium]|jgi:malate dehydrogenase (oxaloacetate-decarboxylating)(NADP+)